MGAASPEVGLPLVALGQVGHPAQALDRRVELGRVGERDRRAGLGHGHGPELVGVGHEGRLQLSQPPHPQGHVGGPVGLVEGPAGRADGVVQVLGTAVGHHPDGLLGGRVDHLEGPARPGRPQLAVDEHALLADHRCGRWSLTDAPPRRPKISSAPLLGHGGQRQVDLEGVGQLQRGPAGPCGPGRPPPAWPPPAPGRPASVNGATVGRNIRREAPPMWTSLALTTSASWASEMPAASASCWPS